LWVGRLAGAAVLIAVVVAGSPVRPAQPAVPRSAQAATPAAATLVRATVTIQHRGAGIPAVIVIRLQPPSAAGDGELLLSMFQRERNLTKINRRVLEPIARGMYRTELLFPSGGHWGYYMRFGPGQAGYAGSGIVDLTPEAGVVDTFTAVLHSGLRGAPPYVQPLGYAAFGALAALALAGVWAVLAWLRSARFGRSAA
jgi:hypothetical protein